MIFGSKAIFAIEVEVNNCFYDKFIGEGKFLVYIYDTAIVMICFVNQKNWKYGLPKQHLMTEVILFSSITTRKPD